MNAGFLFVFAVTPAAGERVLLQPACRTGCGLGLLGVIAVVVKLISYVLNGLDDVYAFIGAVGRCIWRHGYASRSVALRPLWWEGSERRCGRRIPGAP